MEKITEILDAACRDGVIHGAVCGVVTPRERETPLCVGKANVGLDEEFTLVPEALFDVASVTKTVPVSTLALMALDRGMIELSTPLIDVLPEYASPQRESITLQHLLTQTLDFDFAMSSLKNLSAEKIWETVLHAPLRRPAGSHFFYCNTTSLLLGRVVENLFNGTLNTIAEKELFTPLQMFSTSFRPSLSPLMVATENDPWRGKVMRGEIHDESSWKLNEIMVPGAAGVFSTVPDLQKYCQMILQEGQGFFSPHFLESCFVNHINPSVKAEAALGFELNQPYMGDHRSAITIGKTGFTGSVIVMDFERKVGFVLLTDYTWPQRKASKEGITHLRQRIADALWQRS